MEALKNIFFIERFFCCLISSYLLLRTLRRVQKRCMMTPWSITKFKCVDEQNDSRINMHENCVETITSKIKNPFQFRSPVTFTIMLWRILLYIGTTNIVGIRNPKSKYIHVSSHLSKLVRWIYTLFKTHNIILTVSNRKAWMIEMITFSVTD